MASKKKARKKQSSKRGDHILLKADYESWNSDKPTPRARRNARLVDTVWKAVMRIEKIRVTLTGKMEAAFIKIMGRDYETAETGMSITHPDGQSRIVWERRNVQESNENADQAMALIEAVVAEATEDMQDSMPADTAQLLRYLISVNQRRAGKLKWTPQLQQFIRTPWEHPNLRHARKLLMDGFDVKRSRMYFRLEVKDEHGVWVKYGDL